MTFIANNCVERRVAGRELIAKGGSGRSALALLSGTSILMSCALLPITGAYAQDTAVSRDPTIDDIIVTARKREETSIAVPLAISAVGAKELERRQISGPDALAALVPQLVSGEGGASIQGGIIALRGIGSAEINPFIDQSVAFNIDGVAIAKATARRLSEFDMQQIEVLRGPQTLFFGKNSPGGIISIRTADPSSTLKAQVSAGYEFNAREKQVQGYISGPLSDDLGIRVAFYGDQSDGWVKDITPQTNPIAPAYTSLPRSKEFGGRVTLKYTGDKLDVRAKLSGTTRTGAGPNSNTQIIYCPVGGVPQGGATGECKADDRQSHGDLGSAFLTSQAPGVPYFAALADTPVPSMAVRQMLASVEANYSLADALKLTSVTGYYDSKIRYDENFGYNNSTALAIPNSVLYGNNEFSQELRLASDFKTPFNFTTGGLYTRSNADTRLTSLRDAANPSFLNYYDLGLKSESWSVFGQARWNIVPTVELSAGGRYSHEKKELIRVNLGLTRAPAVPPVTALTWNNFSPDATIAWRPTGNLTMFASYRRGFLSGGFNSGTTLATVTPYDQQKTKGFEGGIKGRFLNNRLRASLVAYDYDVTGLSITTSVNAVALTVNAGKVNLHGVELDLDYAVPQVEGLNLHGSLNWEHARYKIYSVSCWTGQTPAQGCNRALNAAGTAFTLQDLAGTQLLRAPDWTGRLGVEYETAVSDRMKAGLSLDANYSSGFFTDAQSIPFGKQNEFAKLDLTASIGDKDGAWELAAIGRNLSDRYTYVRSAIVVFTGSGTGTNTVVQPDIAAPVSRGREFWLRFTYKFGQ